MVTSCHPSLLIPVSTPRVQGGAILLRSGHKNASVESPSPDSRAPVVSTLQQILLGEALVELGVKEFGLKTGLLGLCETSQWEAVLVCRAAIIKFFAEKTS